MFSKFIERPVLSIVISVMIVLLGLLALASLPVSQYPEIEPPSVVVTTRYTGANAEVCTKAVVTPLERSINGVPGMTHMSSVSGNDGVSIITVYFKVGTDPDIAAVAVQNRVATVLDELPEEVVKAGVITEKEVNSMLLYINLRTTDTTLDEKFVYNFADINILSELKRIDGVGLAEIMGQREYAMRIWLNPHQMDAYHISTEEIVDAVRKYNVEAAPGKIGESSGKMRQSLQYVLRYTGKITLPREYENIIVRTTEAGDAVRIRDVADVEFGSLDYDVLSKENGRPSAAIILKQRPGSNASEVIAAVKSRLEWLSKATFPPGMTYTLSYDVSRFLDASISAIITTLIEAFLLVAFVVFIFLQDARSTVIPVLAVPVSLVGTLAVMKVFGFSINLLTLFALVLSIGIVVDNAIVVVEAVHARMKGRSIDIRTATQEVMRDITRPIVSITLVMSAVFIPVAFLSGPVGVFYRQFSITLAVSIVISGINAVTLTPALCPLILRPHGPKKGITAALFGLFNRAYDAVEGRYISFLKKIVSRRVVTIAALVVFFAASIILARVLPTGFIPTEDQGTVYVSVMTPPGATIERTESVMDKVDRVAMKIEGVESISSLSGYNMMTDGSGASFGMSTINLKHWDERKLGVNAIIDTLKKKTAGINDAKIQFFPPPPVPGFGNASGFELQLQDRSSSQDLQKLADATSLFIAELSKRPEIGNVFTTFDPTFPQFMIHIDGDAAARKGVTVDKAMNNLQALIGSYYVTNFIRFGQLYKVMVQAHPRYRALPTDILKLSVKNDANEMVPYSAFARIERVFGPEQWTRYNMFTSAMLNGEPAEGYSTGDAVKAISEVAAVSLPKGFSIEWFGMTREEVESGSQVIYVFLICLVFVYLLLAAQYESFVLPFAVLLSLPAGICGALFFLSLFGLENNIYAQVSMVMLIGLLGKNAILIVEYAESHRRSDEGVLRSVIAAARARIRPILMTSFAFIAGLVPLMVATGAGAIGNRTIGTAAAGGMLAGTVAGIFIVPGLYVLLVRDRKRRLAARKQEAGV